MSNPSAFVLFDAPVELNASTIVREFERRYPDRSVSPPASSGSNGSAVVLSVSGATVALMRFDAPLPDGWQEAASRAKTHWPDAEAVLDRHRAHVIVTVMGEGKDRRDVARVVTAVTGALVATAQHATAVLWDLTVANSSQVFAELSRMAFSPYPDFPMALWVSMHPFSRSRQRAGRSPHHGAAEFHWPRDRTARASLTA
jgi:hypothetical protein